MASESSDTESVSGDRLDNDNIDDNNDDDDGALYMSSTTHVQESPQVPLRVEITPKSLLRTIIVGPEKHSFTMNEHYLIKSSRYFRAILSKEWATPGVARQPLVLPDTDPQLFEVYVRWRYSPHAKFMPPQDADAFPHVALPGVNNVEPDAINTLIVLVLMAGFLMDAKFENNCLDILVQRGRATKPQTVIALIVFAYANAPRKSGLCRLFRDVVIERTTPEELGEMLVELPKEIMQDVGVEMSKRITQTEDWRKNVRGTPGVLDNTFVPKLYHYFVKEEGEEEKAQMF